MSILRGEKTIVEGFDQFRNSLDVENDEILEAIPESERAAIVESFNDLSDDYDADPVNSVTELPHWAIDEFVLHWLSKEDRHWMIIAILENRDLDYVHLFEKPIHTIVEIHE